MIRPGILLYGYSPDHACDGMIDVKPVMEVKSRIGSVKKLPKGTCISYGRTYTLERDSVVAAVPIGYADGLNRTALQPPGVRFSERSAGTPDRSGLHGYVHDRRHRHPRCEDR